MKFHFYILLCVLSIITIDFSAQITEFNWSNQISKSSAQTFKKLLIDDHKNMYVIQLSEQKKGTIYLDILDSLGTIILQKTIELPFDRFENSFIINNNLYIFGTSFDVKNQMDVLSAFQISNTGILSSTQSLMKMKANGEFHCLFNPKVSPNKKYINVVCTHPYREKQSERLTSNLYTSNFKEVNSTNLSTSLPGKKRRTTVSTVNNNGFVYIIKKYRVKTKTLYDLFTVEAHGSHGHNHIYAKTKKIADMNYKLNTNGDLVIAGFYSSPSRKNFEGVFAMNFKESVYPNWTKSYLLNEDIITTFKSKKEIGTNGYGLDRFHIKQFITNINGDLIFTAEHHSIIQDKKLGTLDYRKGLVAVQLNKSGGMKGVIAIQLDQKDAINAGGFSSHILSADTHNIFVFCNKIGPIDEKIKLPKNAGAAVHIEQNMISESMNNTSSFPNFNPHFNNYLLQPDIQISNDTVQIILLEAIDSMSYKIGFIYSTVK